MSAWSPPQNVIRWRPQVDKWCGQLQVSQSMVLAIIQQESAGNPDARRYEPTFETRYVRNNPLWLTRCRELNMSTKDVTTSYGLMQLMFTTAWGYGCKNVKQALDPDQAIRFGVAHLAMLLKKFSTPEALAAYNGGEGAVADLRAGRDTAATRYSKAVMALYERYKAVLSGATAATTTVHDGKYFKVKEFECNPKACGCGFCSPAQPLIDLCDKIRGHLGCAVHVESGCRCKKRNAAVGGVANSAHLTGEAADIYTDKHTSAQLIKAIKNFYDRGLLPELEYCYCPGKKTVHVGVDKKPRSVKFKMP